MPLVLLAFPVLVIANRILSLKGNASMGFVNHIVKRTFIIYASIL